MDFEFSNGTITKYTGSGTKVDIPGTINGQQVIKIGAGAFSDCGSLISVNIPSGVTTIAMAAFRECVNLTSVNIPSGVTEIGTFAFSYCESLTSVNIPSGVTTIGMGAFKGCKSLTSVNIPSSVTTIRMDAFEYCNALNSASRAAIQQHSPSTSSSNSSPSSSSGCYVATAVYGSYDCPQVWTLRRYRDCTLAESLFGRAFIRIYYAVSPTVVKWFGKKTWFNHLWRNILDRKIEDLRKRGINNTPYTDRV
ncbi:hypothetical protein AGMMS50268_30980 [Spirochaetia bacterium]|nr:hypothetical protein AGMMS50268_30980 [Spirochaetia bacterium]